LGLSLSWPAAATGFALESATNLNGPWQPVGTTSVPVGDQLTVPVQATDAARFYRLKK